ncbi:hypothetical protein BJ165DRAFT_1400442 [Panaeolus papilionaceus]|nr:hypothetical protein BJ165DRAFT_1400442 [Panaeolus papilionaceus]
MSYQEIVDDRKSQVAEGTDAPAQATDPISTKVQSSIQNDANNQQPQPEIPVNALRVLITGFGPFLHHEVNPSWLAVKPLHNAILYTQPANAPLQLPEASSQSRQSKSKGKGSDDGQSSDKGSSKSPAKATTTPSNVEEFIFSTEPRPIHITTVCIPVVYESVLEIVPGLHARPPNIPAKLFAVEGLPMPESLPQAFDFMFHVGVAGRGPLRMERLGHKFGYHMKDASGRYAQVVKVQSKDFSRQNAAMPGVAPPVPGSPGGMSASGSNNWQAGSLHGGLAQNPNFGEGGSGGVGFGESSGDIFARPTRGFGLPYEAFPEEITTDVDVTRLVYDLKQNGVEQIYTSMDAGHYLCDFIYYCSLAEAQRASKAKAQLWDPKRAITGPTYAAYSSPYTSPPLGSNTPNYSYNSGPALYSPHPAAGAAPGDGIVGTQRPTQVLFLHCPPVNQPLSTEEVTEAIRKIVVWVCGEIVREYEYAAKQAEAANQPQTTATGKDRLVGLTGAGKSTFIESFASSGSLGISKDQLEGATTDIVSYRLINATKNDSPIYLVDTPGFLDRKISEMKVLNMIKDWTKENNLMFDRILYFDRITDTRMAGTKKRSLELFKSITGRETSDYLVFVTTMWDQIWNKRQQNMARQRFQQLQEKHYKDFLDQGAQVVKFHNTQESALNILDLCIKQWRDKLFEYENTRKPVRETPYGLSLYGGLYDRVEALRRVKCGLQYDLENQEVTEDSNLTDALLAQMRDVEADLQRFEQELKEFGTPPSLASASDPNQPLTAPDTASRAKEIQLRNRLSLGFDRVLARTGSLLKVLPQSKKSKSS